MRGRTGQTGHRPPNLPVLARFEPTSLATLDTAALLDRTDTKYLLTESQLGPVLATLAEDYRVLEIDGTRLHHYQTLYFDTPDFSLFRSHCTSRAVRHKVRSRAYVDTGVSFVEVKAKTNKGRTVKHRLQTEALVSKLHPRAAAFVASRAPLDAASLEPTLWNGFHRMTLVSKRHTERLTLDVGLSFRVGRRFLRTLPGIVIAELKQSSVNRNSPFVRQMRATHVQPTSISKYCVGVSLLHGMNGSVKYNAFKATLRALDKLVQEAAHHS